LAAALTFIRKEVAAEHWKQQDFQASLRETQDMVRQVLKKVDKNLDWESHVAYGIDTAFGSSYAESGHQTASVYPEKRLKDLDELIF
jgi:hypothetical protein